MPKMLSVTEAQERIRPQIPPPRYTTAAILHSLGATLAQDIHANTDLPPFANSAVDGFAIYSDDVQNPPSTLRVTMDVPAGHAPQETLTRGCAARIMTGAPIPHGADAVVPVENTDATWQPEQALIPNQALTIQQSVRPGDNVRPIGENIRKGGLVLAKDTPIRPQDIGMLAALGIAEIPVYAPPKIVILSTGDELLPIDAPLTAGKIRDSNSPMLAALVQQYHGIPLVMPTAPDRIEAVRRVFEDAIRQQPQLIISTAGVSVGAFDVVRTVLEEVGEVNFWRINFKPGKPLAFGMLKGIPFFGLPGNPVSAMVTFEVFIRPILLMLSGKPDPIATRQAVTTEDITTDGRETYMRVKLNQADGKLIATPTENQSSGALMSLVLADGLLILPPYITHIPAGTALTVRLLRELPF